jgi:putative ABC transport system substrate-binding protein
MKKCNIIKKFFALTVAAAMCLSFAACGSSTKDTDTTTTTDTEATADATTSDEDTTQATDAETNDTQDTAKTYKIAVVKQMDHASLDEIANAITAQLDVIAAENGITIEYEVYSGQGDQSVLKQIGDQAVADGVDAIIPIATLAAQVMTVCAEETETPVIYAAISDPEAAELTGIDYVTGTSDALNTEFILDMMLAQNPDVQTVGLLYSLSETNSVTPIAEAKAYLDSKGIKYTEATGNTNDEIIAAASVLVSNGVDAVFTPTDNTVMAAELAIADTFIEAGIPHYTGADSFVRNGAFTTCGVNYTDLGTKTADLAYTAITEGFGGLDDYYKMDGGIITVNTETAAGLNIDYSVFADMGELEEVVTTED